VPAEADRNVIFRLGAGFGFVSIDPVKDIKPGLATTGSVGYVVLRSSIELDVGLAGGFSPLVAKDLGGKEGNYGLFSLHGYGAVKIPLNHQVSIRGQLEVGALIIAGINTNNPFTVGGNPANAPLSVPQASARLSLDIQVSKGFSLWLTPGNVGIALAPGGFKPDVSFVKQFNATVGIGLHL
jgi:hypothetical protein